MKYRSCAQWPDSVTGLSNIENITYDLHDTEEQALVVCRLLEMRGFAGDGVIFPLATWTEPAEPMISFCTQLRICHADGSYGSGEGPEEVMEMAFPTEKYLEYIRQNGKPPTFRRSTCRRFGGLCSSGNEQCRMLRGVE